MRKLMPVFLFLLLLFCLPLCAQAGTAQVSGYTWYDSSGSGLYKEGARALPKVTVTLCRTGEGGDEIRVAQQNTKADGYYCFEGLDAGEYYLRATLPSGHQFIAPQAGGSVILPATGQISRSLPFAVAEGQTLDGMHIGASKAYSFIKVYVFVDANQNGGRSTAEAPLRGVDIGLYYEIDGEWLLLETRKSDKDGVVDFWTLTPGTYRLSADLPDGYIIGPLGQKINGWYNCIPPCDSHFGMSDDIPAPRGGSTGVGVGAVSTGSLSGMIWQDENCDGRFSADEDGYAGAFVTLESETAGVSRQLQTAADGQYQFDSLLPGEYTLTVALPESAMFTLSEGDSWFSEGYAFRQSVSVTVVNQEKAQMQPIGVMPVTTLTVEVYNDLNADGARQADEPPFAGAQLEVLTDDTVRAAAVSDGAGVARIPVLRGGDMEVRLVLPSGQVFTVAGENSDFTAPAATGDLTQPLSLPHGQTTTLSAGVTLPTAISGMLFDDSNITGVLDAGEKGLSAFTVQALNAAGEVVAQTQTDREGRYAFRNLLPAPHTVRFLLVDAYVFSDYSDTGAAVENRVVAQTAAYGESAPISLAPGQSVDGVDGGIFRSATVSGSVLLSTGIASLPAEGGMAGVYVALLDEYGAPVSDTTTAYTDENGAFYLKGALPGAYLLEYTLPESAAFVSPDTGADSVITAPFTVQVADDLTFDPLYAIYTGSLRGTLYLDTDLSASFSADEPVLADVPLTLKNTDLDLLYETRTLDNGEYIFDGLRPGAYALSLALPEGLCFAHDAASPLAAVATSEGEAALSIGIGDHQVGRNIAAAHPAALAGGQVYFDLANNGALDAGDPGAAGIVLSLTSVNGPQSYTLQTDENGLFSLDALVPGRYTLRVTLAGDCIPADSNDAELIAGFWTSQLTLRDGETAAPLYAILRYARAAGHVWSMDGSFTGVAGRSVTLYHNGAPLQTALTDESGAFAFEHLKPGAYALSCDLPEGNYKFARTVDTAARPSYILADASQIAEGTGVSAPFTVAMGAQMEDCDIGIGAMGALGDTAWLDENGNGLQDGGEPNVPGVLIQLYQYGELAAETVTDAFGHYLITDLYPGAYTVRVTVPEELKTTMRREDYPLVSSVLPGSDASTVEAEGILVPSNGRNLNCDFGFVLRKEGKYPASLEQTPVTDWSFEGRRK